MRITNCFVTKKQKNNLAMGSSRGSGGVKSNDIIIIIIIIIIVVVVIGVDHGRIFILHSCIKKILT